MSLASGLLGILSASWVKWALLALPLAGLVAFFGSTVLWTKSAAALDWKPQKQTKNPFNGNKSSKREKKHDKKAAAKPVTESRSRPVFVDDDEASTAHEEGNELDSILHLAAMQSKDLRRNQVAPKKPVVSQAKPSAQSVKPVEKTVVAISKPKNKTPKPQMNRSVPAVVAPVPDVVTLAPDVFNVDSVADSEPESSIAMRDVEVSLAQENTPWSVIPTKAEEMIAALKSRVQTLQKTVEGHEATEAANQKELEATAGKAKELEKELKERTRSFQLRWVTLESELNMLRSQNKELSAKFGEVAELSRQMESMLEDNQRLTQALKDGQAQVQVVAKERDELRKTGNEKDLIVAGLRESVETLSVFRAKFMNAERELSVAKEDIAALEADRNSLKQIQMSIGDEVESITLEKARVEQELFQAVARSQQLENEAQLTADTLRSEMSRLQSELSSTAAARDEAVRSTLESDTMVPQLQSRISELEQELLSLTFQKEQSVAAVKSELDAIIASQNAEIEGLKKTLMSLYGQEKDVNSARNEAQQLRVREAELGTECQKRSHEITSLQAQLKSQQEQYEAKLASVEKALTVSAAYTHQILAEAAEWKQSHQSAAQENDKLVGELQHQRDGLNSEESAMACQSISRANSYIDSIMSELGSFKAIAANHATVNNENCPPS